MWNERVRRPLGVLVQKALLEHKPRGVEGFEEIGEEKKKGEGGGVLAGRLGVKEVQRGPKELCHQPKGTRGTE